MAGKKKITTLDRNIGQRIKFSRISRGITQKQLAKEIGITPQQLQKYEKGLNRISASKLAIVAKELCSPVSDFYDDSVDSFPETLQQQRQQTEILRNYSRIPNDDILNVVRKLMKVLAECL